MEGIQEQLKMFEEKIPHAKKNVGERHVIVGDIHEKLKTSSYKKISISFLATLLSIYETPFLYDLHSKCNQANNYAAMFWYHVKK